MIATFTIPGRVTGKVRLGRERHTARAKAYFAERDRVRAIALHAVPTPWPVRVPVLVDVAIYLAPVQRGANRGELPDGGVSDADNVEGTILDALQTCGRCKRYARGKSRCRCGLSAIVLGNDSPRWFRGGDKRVCLDDGQGERVVVTIREAS